MTPLNTLQAVMRVAPMTRWIIIANVLFFAIMSFLPGLRQAMSLMPGYGFMQLIESGNLLYMLSAALSLVTYAFAHADIFHLLSNMLFFFLLAPPVEITLGSRRFLHFYLMLSVLSGLAFLVFTASPTPGTVVFDESGMATPVMMIGASGAVMGVMAAFLVFWPRAVMLELFALKVRALYVIGLYALGQVHSYLSGSIAAETFWLHLAGFVSGAVVSFIIKERKLLPIAQLYGEDADSPTEEKE
ncbi:MAG TPA: rhomboid family intramembrane serine protease [Candidatus Obscuribacterales bacterium]